MPFPDSDFPSVVRGYTPTQSLRLMNEAAKLRSIVEDMTLCIDGEGEFMWDDSWQDWQDVYRRAKEVLDVIDNAEGDAHA